MKQHPIHKHIFVSEDGKKVYSNIKGIELKQGLNTHGYLFVSVTVKEGVYKQKRVHRLVAETYHGIKEGSWDVHHKDHCKTNNHKDNLMWATRSENILAAIDHGVNPSRGETHPSAVYTEDFIKEVCQRLQDGMRNIDIEAELGIPRHQVAHIKKGDIWGHVSRNYKFKIVRNRRISLKTIKAICELLQSGKTCDEVSKTCKVPFITVKRIHTRETYTNISEYYSF